MSKKRRKENLGPSPILMWILVLVLVVALFFLVNSSLFNVTDISVKGNSRFTSQEIIASSGINYDTNILQVDEEQAKTNIQQNAFIVVKDIKRIFPTGVEIIVSERIPVAQIGTVNGYYVIDKEGIALGLNSVKDETLTAIYNLGIAQPQYGQRIMTDNEEKLQAVFAVLEAMEEFSLNEKITGVDVNDPQKILLTYENYVPVRIAGATTAKDRLKYLEATVEAVKDKLLDGQTVNMENSGGYYIG